jgi:hypothetical protein
MKIKDVLRGLFRRLGEETRSAPRFVAHASARLVLRLTREDAKGSANHLFGGTLNISETGLAVLVPSSAVGSHLISEGDELQAALDIHPLGVVMMRCEVARVGRLERSVGFNTVLGLKITEMNHKDRALYLEYIGTRGWEGVEQATQTDDG